MNKEEKEKQIHNIKQLLSSKEKGFQITGVQLAFYFFNVEEITDLIFSNNIKWEEERIENVMYLGHDVEIIYFKRTFLGHEIELRTATSSRKKDRMYYIDHYQRILDEIEKIFQETFATPK